MSLSARVFGILSMFLVGCAAPAKFKVGDTPQLDPGGRRSILNSDRISERSEERLRSEPGVAEVRSAADRIAFAEAFVATARKVHRRELARALGYYLSAADLCYGATDEDPMLRELYNLSCAEIAHLVHGWEEVSSQGGLSVDATGRRFRLRLDQRGKRVALSSFDSLTPTARVDLGDLDEYGGRNVQEGIGGSLVGYRSSESLAGVPITLSEGMTMPVTSVIEFPAEGQAVLSLYDVGLEDDVTVGGRRTKLAADFAAPLARIAADATRGYGGFRAMIRPAKYQSQEGLFFLEPFREDKIPLILVHGLTSAPKTWRWIHSPLTRDEKLRENYQVWVYRYPTGPGLGETTKNFRRHLREVMDHYNPHGRNAALNQTVLFGHSMGGLLSSAMIRSSEDRIWNQMFDVPIDELEVGGQTREEIRDMVFFDAQPYISRVVFIATPHRGSNMATDPIGRLVNGVIKVPSNLLQLKRPGVLEAMSARGQSWIGDHSTSIDSLKPNSWRLEILNDLPIRDGVTYHSIVGDRGKGDTPNSSDGTVPYWSSHLEGAASEVIVPSNHSVHRHPEAHAELRRILHEHLRKVGR